MSGLNEQELKNLAEDVILKHTNTDDFEELAHLEWSTDEMYTLMVKALKQANDATTGEKQCNLPVVVGSALLEELLNLQQEIICSPRRDVVITAESIKKVFEKRGIKWIPPF